MRFGSGVMLTVRRRAETKDDLGDISTVVTTEQWGPCAVAPRYARESVDPTQPRVVVGKEVYGPAFDFTAADEILIDGKVWQVDGEPEDFTGTGANPFTGWAPGIVVPVKRASGS